MKRLCLILAASLAPLMLTPSAHALSCAPPDLQRELTKAIESDKVYHIFVGHFTTPEKPRNQLQAPPPGGSLIFTPSERSETVSGTFDGYSMGKTRAQDNRLANFPVQIKTSCAASWCGKPPRSDRKMIAFVQAQEDGPPLLSIGPCPYMSHHYSEDKELTLRSGL